MKGFFMKREELTELGLEGDMLEKVMALHGTDIEKHKAQTSKEAARADRLEATIGEMQYSAAAGAAVNGIKFSSKSAKTAFEKALCDAKLTCENGALTGFDEFLNSYRADDAAAFETQEAGIQPVIMRPTGSQNPAEMQSAALREAFGLR